MGKQLTNGNIGDWINGSEMGGPVWDKMNWDEAYLYGAQRARDHYERLISNGNLVVVARNALRAKKKGLKEQRRALNKDLPKAVLEAGLKKYPKSSDHGEEAFNSMLRDEFMSGIMHVSRQGKTTLFSWLMSQYAHR